MRRPGVPETLSTRRVDRPDPGPRPAGESFHESLEQASIHDHIALFHSGVKDILAAAAPFLQAGLSRGEKCLLYCRHDTVDEILADLRTRGVDVGNALAHGRILVARPGAREDGPARDLDGTIDFLESAAREARAERYRALRLCLDPSLIALGGRGREPHQDPCVRLHAFLADHDSLSLCLYGLKRSSPEAALGALRSHPLVVHDGKVIDNVYCLPDPAGRSERNIEREVSQRLTQLADLQDRIARTKRQAIRLRRFREITASLLTHARLPDLLRGVTEGVIALGYRMCWIGMANAGGSVTPVAIWGDRRGYLKEIEVRWDDTPAGRGPVGTAIRTGKPSIIRDVTRSRAFAPWRERALAHGFLSVAAFPLRSRDKVVGALAVYAPGPGAFDRESVEELSAFALQVSLILRHVESRRALAESEERFRTVVEDADILVLELDPQGRIRLFNRAAEKATGRAASEVLGKDFVSLLVPERERDRVSGELRRVAGGRETEGFTAAVLARDGGERLVSWSGKVIRSAREQIRGVVALGVDVTEKHRIEAERKQSRASMVRSQRMEALSSMAGGVAHELNNILEPIMGYTSLLMTQMGRGNPYFDSVERIHRSVKRAGEITEQLLGFARGGQHDVGPVALNEIVRRVLAALGRSLPPSIEVVTSLHPSLPEIEGNAGQLENTLLNVCLNARDAMPGGGTLTITTGRAALEAKDAARFALGRPGDYVFIEVRDTGRGMPKDVKPHVFEPFFSTRRDEGHLGLGLALAYGIVRSHSGGIHVESAPGRGSAFRIYLPAEPFPRGTETVLVVDDEPAIREVGEALLSAAGYRTITAEDGEAACRIVRERRGGIDLVLLDIVMPGMGGQETFRTLRRMEPGIPVLLSSGYAQEGAAQEILDEGADGFIQKPYGLPELARAIRRILDTRRSAPAQRKAGA